MPTLVVIGLGYAATHILAEVSGRFDRIVATVRDRTRAQTLGQDGLGGIALEVVAFDGQRPHPRLAAALRATDALILCAPPDGEGDPVLRVHGEDLLANSNLAWIGYLSTIGVYGDRQGAWVDEMTRCAPSNPRSMARLAAEQAWTTLGESVGATVALLRLAGIYGVGRNALVSVRDGTARNVIKPGQVFNRIHADDIAGCVAAALDHPLVGGPINVTDNEPAPPQDVLAYAAMLLGTAPPLPVSWEEATNEMSPMALSFYGEIKRVRNTRLKRDLAYRLRYPTYRTGLEALYAAGEGR